MAFLVGAVATVAAALFCAPAIIPLLIFTACSCSALAFFVKCDNRNRFLADWNVRQNAAEIIRENKALCDDGNFKNLAEILSRRDADVEMLLRSEPACKAFATALKDTHNPVCNLAHEIRNAIRDRRLRAILKGKAIGD
ncbi:MAG: hypothetical protein LBI39_03300 [Puniceicoccales bacterium]|nr:hypothetical protein [Puniceicoccales bacterium]